MLAKRIIPTLLRDGDNLVKGERFNGWRSVGHARQAVRVMANRGVDEMVLLDITATPQGRRPDPAKIREYADECFMPLTVGGGIRSIEDVRTCLDAGADKIAIGKAARDNPEFVTKCATWLGCQAIVVTVDYHDGENPVQMALDMESAGAGEIILTSIDLEGTMEGYDLQMIQEVSLSVGIPVIAHGGCSGYADMLAAIQMGASAVAAGALFQFSDCTPKGAARYLHEHGVEVRL